MTKENLKDKKKEKDLVKKDDNAFIEQDKKSTRGKIIFTIIVCLSILLIIYASLFGIKLRFNLSDELEIKLSPLEQTFNTVNNNNINLNFNIQNNNFAECKSVCEFRLVDLSENKILFSENQTLNHDEIADKNFTILTPEKGSGEKVYSFKVECKNIRSLICFTDEKPRKKSSIVFVNYDLRKKEKKAIAEIKPKIENLFILIKSALELQKQSTILLARIPGNIAERSEIEKKLKNDQDSIESERIKIKEMTESWKNQDYLEINSTFSEDDINKANSIISSINLTIAKEINLISLRNNNTQLIKNFNKSVLSEAHTYYLSEINSENLKRLEEIESVSESIHYDYLILNNTILFSEKNLTEKLSNDVKIINILDLKLKNITSEGNNLVKKSISSLIMNNISVNNLSLNKSFCSNLFVLDRKIKEELGLMKNNSNKTSAYIHLNDTLDKINIYRPLNCKNSLNSFNNSELINLNKTMILLKTNFSELQIIDYHIPEVNVDLSTSLDKNPELCCVFQECRVCKNYDKKNIPAIFIHGHSVNDQNNPEFSMNLFTKIQGRLENDKEIVDAGQLDLRINPENITANSWGRIGKPLSVRSSYYYITYYDIGGYTVSAQKYDRIENYAIRLKEIIDLVKLRTGSDKVNIVAHSMGGLVAREYITLFGGDDINKLITVNTPNHGISGRVAKLCSVIGSEKECEDMKEGSVFLNRLNSRQVPENIKLYAIRSIGCEMQEGEGDGIVTAKSAYLEKAENFLIQGNCTDDLQTNLHSKVLDPEEHPEAYEIIKGILT